MHSWTPDVRAVRWVILLMLTTASCTFLFSHNMSVLVFVPVISRLQAISLTNDSRVEDIVCTIWAFLKIPLQYQGVELRQLSLRSLTVPVLITPQDTLCKRVTDSVRDKGFESPQNVSFDWLVDEVHVHVFVYVDRGSVMRAAESLHRSMWGNKINSKLEAITDPDDEGVRWKYMPKKYITSLQLKSLGYPESHAFLIRPEYETLLTSFSIATAIARQCGGVVVSGQPGIGKTCFLYYLLLWLLCNKTPVALQLSRHVLVFHDGGVDIHHIDTVDVSAFPDNNVTWVLSDTNEASGPPCAAFLAASREDRAWIVQTTSPLETRWKTWCNQFNADIFIMDHFSIQEIRVLSGLLGIDFEKIRRVYEQWGPSARICTRLTRDPKTSLSLEQRHEEDAKRAAIRHLKEVTAPGISFDAFNVPHILFSITPDKTNRQIPIADIATDHLRAIVAYAAADVAAHERITFYETISKQPMFSTSAGKMFESFVLTWLTCEDLGPLTCTADGHPNLQIPTCGSEQHQMICGSLSALATVPEDSLPFCFLPASPAFQTVDAIVFTRQCIFLIQVTIADKHGANREGFEAIEEHLPAITVKRGCRKGRPAKRAKRCYVFITDEENKAKSLRRQTLIGLPQDYDLYSAVFSVSQFKIDSERMRKLDEVRQRANEAINRQRQGQRANEPEQSTGSSEIQPMQIG